MVNWVVCAGGLGFFLDAPKGRSPGLEQIPSFKKKVEVPLSYISTFPTEFASKTLPKPDIAPKNWWLEDDPSFWGTRSIFRVRFGSF